MFPSLSKTNFIIDISLSILTVTPFSEDPKLHKLQHILDLNLQKKTLKTITGKGENVDNQHPVLSNNVFYPFRDHPNNFSHI